MNSIVFNMKLLAIFVAAICSIIAFADGLPQCYLPVCFYHDPVCALPVNGVGGRLNFDDRCQLIYYNCRNPGNQYYESTQGVCQSI